MLLTPPSRFSVVERFYLPAGSGRGAGHVIHCLPFEATFPACRITAWEKHQRLLDLHTLKSPTSEPSSCKLSKMWTCIWFQQGTRTCAINVRREWNGTLPIPASLLLLTILQLYHLPRLLSLTPPACSFDARPCMPAVVLYYCTFQGTLRLKIFFLCYLCEKYYKPITAQLLLFRCSVMPDSSRPHGLQHTRLPCPSSHPGACSNSRPMSRWCHPTISTSVDPFSSCLQSFPASGCFLISQLFK